MRAFLAAIVLLFALPLAANDLAFNLSGVTGPDFGNQLNDTDVEVARFVVQASGGAVQVEAITVHVSNFALADEAFTAVRLFYDANNNSSFEVGEQVGTDQVPNGTTDDLTFTGTVTAPNGGIRSLQLRVDIGTNATVYGEAFDFSVDPQVDIALNDTVNDQITTMAVATSNTLTIRHSENQLVPGTGNPAAPRTAGHGSSNFPALQFIVSSLTPTAPGQLQGIDLNSITISITCASAAETGVVTGLTLWQDDGDSSFEPGSGEVLIQSRSPADVTKWIISTNVVNVTFDGTVIQNLTDIPSGSASVFWVGISFGGSPDATCEVLVNRTGIVGALGTDADWVVTSPSFISGDVISVATPPPPAPSASPPGEGGCSSTETSGWYLLVVVATALFVTICRNHSCKRKRL
ncbi:MAG: hypothetical protein KDB82_13945 [Planctomycetes bacterium]|nr:hypothetical protein [Planctomycetota bacterium]